MKTSHTRRSRKTSHDDAKKPTDNSRAPGAKESRPRHEHTLPVREVALRARETSAQTRADVERLMGQMREANERLIVSAVQAQNLSDEAHLHAALARAELDALMG